MDNVIQFPQSPRVSLFMAEEYVKQEMRNHLGACVGLLHGQPTYDDLRDIAQHLTEVARLIESIVGVREACK